MRINEQDNRCVVCGCVIPYSSQVCPNCFSQFEDKQSFEKKKRADKYNKKHKRDKSQYIDDMYDDYYV